MNPFGFLGAQSICTSAVALDIVIVWDESNSMTDGEWEKIRDFTEALVASRETGLPKRHPDGAGGLLGKGVLLHAAPAHPLGPGHLELRRLE